MKYFPHDSNAFQDEKITMLYIEFGYEGLGLFYTILEKLTFHEKPINSRVLKKQLNVGKKLEKCWNYMEEIGLLITKNDKTDSTWLPKNIQTERLSYQSPKEWSLIRVIVFERDNYTCTYCGTREAPLECDHIIPFSRGGSDELKNLTTACQRCNRQKKDKSPTEFMAWRAERI